MKRTGALLLVAALVVGLSGCGPAAPKEWTIPFLNCVTGPIASYGEMFQWSAERAAKEINDAGGINGKQIKIVAVDTGSDIQKGAVEMAKVAKDALVALGPVPEPVIDAAMPIAVENKMMSMTATTSYEYAVKYFPWTVSWFPPTEQRLGALVAAWAVDFKDMKKVIQFVEPYGPWPGMADAHASGLKGMGITMLDKVEVPTDAVTFGPLVVKALAAKPDGIVLACTGDKAAKIVKELKSRGWKKMGQILLFSSADVPELFTTGGKDLNGTRLYNYIDPGLSTPRWQAVAKAYSDAHNGNPAPSLLTNYYDAVYMVKEAIEKTKVTGNPKKLAEERKLIADYCANVKGFQGIMFTWDMTNGVPAGKPTYIFEIQDGQKKLVKEVK